jgi:hypothetical protein
MLLMARLYTQVHAHKPDASRECEHTSATTVPEFIEWLNATDTAHNFEKNGKVVSKKKTPKGAELVKTAAGLVPGVRRYEARIDVTSKADPAQKHPARVCAYSTADLDAWGPQRDYGHGVACMFGGPSRAAPVPSHHVRANVASFLLFSVRAVCACVCVCVCVRMCVAWCPETKF